MKQRDLSKRLSGPELFEDALCGFVEGFEPNPYFLFPDEQVERAVYILSLSTLGGFLRIWRKYTAIWSERSMSEVEGQEMNAILLNELAAAQIKRSNGQDSKLFISQFKEASKSGDLDEIFKLVKSLDTGSNTPKATKLEMFLIRHWAEGGEIGDFSFPPLCTFSAESICDLAQVALKMDGLTPDAVRKVMGRKLRLTSLTGTGGLKVSPTKLAKAILRLRKNLTAIEEFNQSMTVDAERFGQS